MGDTARLAPQVWIFRSEPAAFSMPTTLTITKDVRGQWRWVAISSTAYQDRDGEIVSQKALAADVARADADGDYGPLLWWHVPGAVLGQCDYNAMSGRCLVESGTFRSEALGAAMATKASNQGISIGFEHPSGQPGAARVYEAIRRRERSVLPADRSSNLFTRFGVKGPSMDATKKAALASLVGELLADETAALAAATEKAAELAGVAYKEARPLVIDGVTYVPQAPPAEAAPPAAEPVAAEPPATTKAEGDAVAVETEATFDRALGDYIIQGIAALLADMKSGDAQAEATKEANDTAQRQQLERQITELQQQLTTQKESTEAALKAAQAQLAELTQAQPRALGAGYRPSRDESTVVKQATPVPVISDLTRGADFIVGPGGQLS